MSMQSGFVVLDKPAQISSAAALNILKKQLPRGIKIGHAGTLDPMATGVLVALIGRGTKLASYVQGGKKVYSGRIRLGVTTDSDDAEGSVLEERSVPDSLDLEQLKASFQGDVLQLPPRVSAKKVAGKRAYALTRKGEQFTLQPVKVHGVLEELTQVSSSELDFIVCTGSGFYVRSMARDIGEMVGCGAHLTRLRREFSAPFSVSDACSPDKPRIQPLAQIFQEREEQTMPGSVFDKLQTGALSTEQFASLCRGSARYLIIHEHSGTRGAICESLSGTDSGNSSEYKLISWYEDFIN